MAGGIELHKNVSECAAGCDIIVGCGGISFLHALKIPIKSLGRIIDIVMRRKVSLVNIKWIVLSGTEKLDTGYDTMINQIFDFLPRNSEVTVQAFIDSDYALEECFSFLASLLPHEGSPTDPLPWTVVNL